MAERADLDRFDGLREMANDIAREMGRPPKLKAGHRYDFDEGLKSEARAILIAWCREQGWEPTEHYDHLRVAYWLSFGPTDGVQMPPSAKR